MEDSNSKEFGEKFSYITARVLFPLLLLISLDGLVAAERAHIQQYPGMMDSLYTHLAIAIPWLFNSMGGAIIWLRAKRQLIDKQTAAVLLILLSTATSSAYEVLGKFATAH